MNKKLFDLFGASVLLVITAPLCLLIAILIKTTSRGPVIFRQTRLGYRGKPFVMFKFRTLRDKSGRPFDTVLPGDQRVSVLGRFLRKTYMDELPQLINVLLGQMSLVGPRPIPAEVARKRLDEIPGYRSCFDIRPGLTGLQQIHGRMWSLRHGPQRVLRLDLFYINHRCICFDLYILLRTVEMVLRCKGV